MEKINVAELLRNCPKGMELDCIIFNGKVYFEGIDDDNSAYPIKISVNLVNIEHLDIYGQYNTRDYSKCVIFPKGKTTWEGFQIPFKDGDIVAFDSKFGTQIFLFKEYIYDHNYAQCYLMLNCNGEIDFDSRGYFVERFATEEEKQKLFDSIKANGYKWNPETKTLEKLIKPKFKVGDRIKHKENSVCVPILITNVSDEFYYSNTKNSVGILSISEQDEYELVPVEPKFKVGDRITLKNCNDGKPIYKITKVKNDCYETNQGELPFYYEDSWKLVPNKFDITTLKAFDKVLVRGGAGQKWTHDFFGFMDKDKGFPFVCVGHYVIQCIPYEGNEHLLGKTDDCSEYFKIWKN